MPRLDEIRLQRGRLLERITTQRYVLINEVQPLRRTLNQVDQFRQGVRDLSAWVKRNPVTVGLVTAVLVAFNIRRTWRLTRRGFFLWRFWRAMRNAPLSGWQRFW